MKHENKKLSPQPLQWDKINSSYWWHIKLDATNPKNFVPEIFGYSKAQQHDEAKDKQQLLMRKIIMLHTNDYLHRCTCIDIYKRTGFAVNKKQDQLYLSLTPKAYSIEYAPLLKQYKFIF